MDELLQQFNVKENLDKLHAVAAEAKARKLAEDRGESYEGHDVWRENLPPRAAVRARTIPLLEKERDRLKMQLAEVSPVLTSCHGVLGTLELMRVMF